MAERYDDDDLLTVRQAAAIANCHATTIQRAYRTGTLRAYRARGSRMVRLRYADLREWMMGEPIACADGVPDSGPVGMIAVGHSDTRPASLKRRLELLKSSQRRRGASGPVRGDASARRAEERATAPPA